jgi:catechol 2,3-dioxygenase-like lactoylglutathione lyase family enzyme
MTAMDITIHASFLPHDDPDASLAFYRDILGFEVRNDVEYGGMHWITVGPGDQPATSIVLYPPAATPDITDDERRPIAEMMAKRTYANINLATTDLDGTFERAAGQRRRSRPGADRATVRAPRLRLPRSRGQPDPHPGAALSRPAIAPEVKRLGLVRRTEVLRNG